MKYLKDFEFSNKRVLVRCDFNVSVDEAGNVLDDFRIRAALPTIKYLLDHNAKVIIMSHLGQPEGMEEGLRLNGVRKSLEKLLGFAIAKTEDCVGNDAENQSLRLENGQVLLLENLRFHREETENGVEFAKQLSALADIYINDAFSVCHRAHASVDAIAQFLPHGAGLQLQAEIENLGKILHNPSRPLVAIIGGAKVKTKAKFIDTMSRIADTVIVGGLLAKEAKENNIVFSHPEKIIQPLGDLGALDISEESVDLFRQKILQAKTVVWNGAFGQFEEPRYKKGTAAIASAIIESGAFSVVGGGETVEFLQNEGLIEKFGYVSTGGGAMIEFLGGEKLSGLVALGTIDK